MKCKLCGGKMKWTIAEKDTEVKGKKVRVINIPAARCDRCGDIAIHPMVENRFEDFAAKYCGDVIDFKKCADKEDEDFMAATMFLWMS